MGRERRGGFSRKIPRLAIQSAQARHRYEGKRKLKKPIYELATRDIWEARAERLSQQEGSTKRGKRGFACRSLVGVVVAAMAPVIHRRALLRRSLPCSQLHARPASLSLFPVHRESQDKSDVVFRSLFPKTSFLRLLFALSQSGLPSPLALPGTQQRCLYIYFVIFVLIGGGRRQPACFENNAKRTATIAFVAPRLPIVSVLSSSSLLPVVCASVWLLLGYPAVLGLTLCDRTAPSYARSQRAPQGHKSCSLIRRTNKTCVRPGMRPWIISQGSLLAESRRLPTSIPHNPPYPHP